MNRVLLGGWIALCLMGIGFFWLQGRAEVEQGAPPPEVAKTKNFAPDDLPTTHVTAQMVGPALPEATEATREQRRFGRYDRNRDGRISRNEMLSTRADAFRKLDKDGNNLLTFEEWAVATVDKFDLADVDKDQYLTAAEFRTTAPPEKPKNVKTKCAC